MKGYSGVQRPELEANDEILRSAELRMCGVIG